MPMEQMPTLEIDGKIYHQTRAIGRYLAKQCQLYGSSELQDMEIDMCIDDIEDWRLFYTGFYHEKEPMQKARLLEIAIEKTLWYLKRFEERLSNNAGFFVGGKVSWANVHFSAIIELVSKFAEKDFIQDYPALEQLYNTVCSSPKIKAYLDKRPKTPF